MSKMRKIVHVRRNGHKNLLWGRGHVCKKITKILNTQCMFFKKKWCNLEEEIGSDGKFYQMISNSTQ